MGINTVSPVLQASEVMSFYGSTFNYPAIKPWDNTGLTLGKFYPNFGTAALTARLQQVGITNVYDVYFYGVQNYGYFRYSSQVTAPGPGVFLLEPVFDFNSGKVLCGFYSYIGNTITADIFESNITHTFSDETFSEPSMNHIYSGSFDTSYFSDDQFQSLTLTVFPAGGILNWGLACFFTALAPRPVGQAYWAYTVLFDPINTLSYPIASTWPESTGIQRTDCPHFLSTGTIQYIGNDTYMMFETLGGQNIAFNVFTANSASSPISLAATLSWIIGLTLQDYNGLAFANYWHDAQNNWYGSDKGIIFQFSPDFSAYRKITLFGADSVARNFFRTEPLNSDIIWGYSRQNNSILISNSPSVAPPVMLTNVPVRIVQIAGPGPIWPVLNLECQNFCLPLFRMKKYV